jgi:hypothetical protein
MFKGRWSLAFATIFALGAAGASRVAAQGVTTGGVSGVVTNSSGAGIESAQVQIVNTSTGARAGSLTRTNGLFNISGLEVGGPYTISVRRIGFQPSEKTGVRIALGQVVRIDLKMTEQTTTLSAVNVSTDVASAVMSPTHTGVGTSVSDSSLRRLPSLDRNFTDFVALVPQVSTTLKSGSGLAAGLSGGGVNNRYNQIQIDGSGETDLFGLGSTGQPGGQAGGKSIGLESVKEYQILLTPFDVRQGNFVGLLVNAVTKSGTNDVHGSAYYVGRNESFTRSQPYINDYSQQQYGFTMGGPIIRDKVFFFVNPEWQQQSTPALGYYLGAPGSNLTQATVDRFSSDLTALGITPGGAGQVTNDHPLTNFFGRLDFHLPWNSTLVLRDNYGKARQDAFSRGSTGSLPSFPLTSYEYQYLSTKNNIGGQLRTNFNNGAFNELLVGVTRIRDDRPGVGGRFPMVTATVSGEASLVAGTERYSQGNELDQDITELTDNFTYPVGSHSITVGAQGTLFKARNLYAQATAGVWTFGDLDSLEAGQANQYIVGVPVTGDGAVRFKAQNFSAYVQDMWNVTDRFNLTYGVRFDMPRFNDRPPVNPAVLALYGRNTSEIPSGHVQYSPRIGFNWDVTGDQRNQLRGGIGSFVGHPAYVWLGNAFQNSGLTGVALLTCTARTGDELPTFNSATVANPPSSCGSKTPALGGEIDVLSPDLRFPQDVRASLGFDHAIGDGLVVTFEGLFSHAIYAPFYQNIALAGPQGVDAHGRVMYGPQPSKPVLVDTIGRRNAVYDVTNQNKDRSYSLTAGIQRRFLTNWSGSIFYTYTNARDVQSLTSSTAASNYAYGRRWSGDESSTALSTSDFDQPHRLVAQGTYSFRTQTDLSFTYIGSSGTPFDYINYSDMNGDGNYSNDPIYIPKDATDPNEIMFSDIKSGATVTHTAAEEAQAFDDFIQNTPCLRKARGTIMQRNSCRAPWSNVMNVSLRQSLPTFHGQHVSVQLDVFNFLNLLNKNWGEQAFTYSDVTLLYGGNVLADPTGSLITTDANATQPLYQFTPGAQPKFNFANIESNYQMQLSLRYSF